jgi:sRNA-binding regulator protein Hfq
MNKQIALDLSPAEPASAASMSAVLDPAPAAGNGRKAPPPARRTRTASTSSPVKHFAAIPNDDHGSNRQAELFYLQKQIQLQTQMVFILEDGARVQGIVEWYDRNSIKVRGKSRQLIYKSAIKYLYKAGEVGSAPDESLK